MGPIAREQQHWVVQPLMDAGLSLEEIRVLVFRLSFDAIVHADRGAHPDVLSLVRDQPVEVQAAWAHTIGRLIMLDEQDG